MYLSYSGYKLFKSCPRAFYHRYLDKTVPPERENKVNSLYGTVVGLLFETFYAERLWSQKGVAALLGARAAATLDQAIVREQRGGMVDFSDPKSNYKSKDALLDDIRAAIPRGLGIIRHHRLLGKDALAEVKLDWTTGPHTIGGRADFILTRIAPDNDLLILDGKGSKWREKYVDVTQLHWYAMLYQKHHGRLPDRLGFVFWRCEAGEAVDWVEVDEGVTDSLCRDVVRTMDEIAAQWGEMEKLGTNERLPLVMEHYGAKPDRGGCRLCAYSSVCPEGRSLLRPGVDMEDAVALALGNEG